MVKRRHREYALARQFETRHLHYYGYAGHDVHYADQRDQKHVVRQDRDRRRRAAQRAFEDKKRIATLAKQQNLDAIHDTVHEMAKDEARHGKGFEGLYNRYFKNK